MKTLGQIAYEANVHGGQQNWGPWKKAPDIVRGVHEAMAKALVDHVFVDLIRNHQADMFDEERLELWEKIQKGYCGHCGTEIISGSGECYCHRDD